MKKTVKKKVKATRKTSRTRASFPKKEPRGISSVVVMAIVALVLAGIGSVYVLSQQKGNDLASTFKQKALSSECSLHDPELCKFMNNWESQDEYGVTTTSNYDNGTMESVYEMDDDADAFRMVSKTNGKETSHMISIGKTTYTYDYKDKIWYSQTMTDDIEAMLEENNITETFSFDEDKEKEDDKTKYTLVGKEACGDLQCFKYEILNSESPEGKLYIWFDDKEYRMRKILMEDKEHGSSESVFTYDDINITAPSPVKEGVSTNSGYSEVDLQQIIKEYREPSKENVESSEPMEEEASDY